MGVNKINMNAYERVGNIENETIKLIDESPEHKLANKTAEQTLIENGMQSVEIVEDDKAMWGPNSSQYTFKNEQDVYYKDINIDGSEGTEYSKLLACVDEDGEKQDFQAITRQFDDGRTEKVMYQMNDAVVLTKDGKEVELSRRTVEEANTMIMADSGNGTLGGTEFEVAEQVLENQTGTKWNYAKPPEDWDSTGFEAVKDADGNITCYVRDIEDADGHKGKQWVKFLETTDDNGKTVNAMVDNHQYSDRSSVREITVLDEKEPVKEEPTTPPRRPSGGGGGGGSRPTTPTCPDTPQDTDNSSVDDKTDGDTSTGGTDTVKPDDSVEKPDPEKPSDTTGEQGSNIKPDTPEGGNGVTIDENPQGAPTTQEPTIPDGGNEPAPTPDGSESTPTPDTGGTETAPAPDSSESTPAPDTGGESAPDTGGGDCPAGGDVAVDDSSSGSDIKKKLE